MIRMDQTRMDENGLLKQAGSRRKIGRSTLDGCKIQRMIYDN
jgi:hypothetical protein